MNLQDALSFDLATRHDLLSGLLLAAIGVKLASTAILLAERHAGPLPGVARCEAALWWATKLSALAACAAAAGLARLAGDRLGVAVFSGLLALAAVLVAAKAARRRAARVAASRTIPG